MGHNSQSQFSQLTRIKNKVKREKSEL